MDLERCYQILELDRNASPDEIKRAYKDIASVWHPDRFTRNPRLKKKAEEKLKEINLAYEILRSRLAVPHQRNGDSKEGQSPGNGNKDDDRKGKGFRGSGTASSPQDKTEAFFEAGTELVLGLWSYLTSAFHRAAHGSGTELHRDKNKRGK